MAYKRREKLPVTARQIIFLLRLVHRKNSVKVRADLLAVNRHFNLDLPLLLRYTSSRSLAVFGKTRFLYDTLL